LKLGPILTAPNQLTLLRMVFIPFIVLSLLERSYNQALILFVLAGLTDTFDGILARKLHQQTRIGQYLDPIADKLLLSTMFLVLAILHLIKWRYTVLVFSRDIGILGVSAVLYATAGLRDFRPSIFGKMNTLSQIAAVFFVMLYLVLSAKWVLFGRLLFLRMTFAFTILSALHYVLLVGQRMRALGAEGATPDEIAPAA
jgi:cardiolipin synthase (CMP-forming)